MRNASLDVAYLRERGVTVSGTGMSSSYDTAGVPTTAEVAWALILAVLKRVTIEDAAIRAGRWQTGLPANLGGATLGLAGLGRLGASMVAPSAGVRDERDRLEPEPDRRARGRGRRGRR